MQQYLTYLIIFIVLIIIELVYFKIADKYNIIDKPNLRSSHTELTIRGGGVIFAKALIIAFLMGYTSWYFALAVLLVAVVSFIDDIHPLSQLPRLATHLVAVVLICYDLSLYHEAIWILPIVFILMIGWINIFNFMDGINGITVLYALSALFAFLYLQSSPLIIVAILSCIVFGFFNVRRKAKSFAGDVGSITMALLLGYLMIKTIVETHEVAYLLFFVVYGIDAGVTIANRLRKKENIFQAHRSHLYQYLANERKIPHVTVSLIYALVQVFINIVVIYLIQTQQMNYVVLAGMIVVLLIAYFVARRWATSISMQE